MDIFCNRIFVLNVSLSDLLALYTFIEYNLTNFECLASETIKQILLLLCWCMWTCFVCVEWYIYMKNFNDLSEINS